MINPDSKESGKSIAISVFITYIYVLLLLVHGAPVIVERAVGWNVAFVDDENDAANVEVADAVQAVWRRLKSLMIYSLRTRKHAEICVYDL